MTKRNKLKRPSKSKAKVPEMSAGAVIGDTASFAAMGSTFGPIGTVGGAAVGLVKGLFDHFKEKKAENAQEASMLAAVTSRGAVQSNAGSSFNNFRDPWTAEKGGVVPDYKGLGTGFLNNPRNQNRDLPDENINQKVKEILWQRRIGGPHEMRKVADENIELETQARTVFKEGYKRDMDLTDLQKLKFNKHVVWSEDIPEYADGGVTPGGNVVELKGKETTLDPNDNSLQSFDLPKKHPNQSRVPLKEGTVVFPDTMEIPEASPLRKYGKYFAEVSKKIDAERTKAQKILDSKDSTPIARRTAERNIYNADRRYGELTGTLLSEHQRLGIDTDQQGVPKAAAGWIQGVGNFLKSDAGKNTINTLGSLAPVMYNLGQGSRTPETLNPAAFQNPMAYDALQSMSNRQVDVNPMLASNNESAAVAGANLRSSGAGVGSYRAGLMGIQNARMKGNSDVLNQADVQNNAYRGQLGQMQAQLGQQMANTNLTVSDLNSRNEAAGRNYNAAAMGQLGQFSQMQQQMNNQRQRDNSLMPQMMDFMNMFKTGNLPTQSYQTQANNLNPNVGFNISGPKSKYDMLHPTYKN